MATDGTTVAGDNPHPLAPTPVDQPTMQWDGDRMFASTPNMSNHPPPPPPPGPNPTDFDPTTFSLNFAEFGDLDATTLMSDSSLNFERDFAAWFDPENANTS
ncbi:hypothetical protein LXA43DRAFT_1099614 [Ganoderma leucocontextum]|nr:hypothetical protein LXA43DRAFT_1099614 [Ganoderma leucocontextum]